MKLMFYGAAREVTGSCHGIEIGGKKLLIDCGLYQGSDNGYGQNFCFNPSEFETVIITHAHIDHSGRLPLLIKHGFRGKIYATGATCELLEIMLRDSAYIQESEAGWRSRKNRRAGSVETAPLYTIEDAEKVFEHLVPCTYGEEVVLHKGVKFKFTDAGHLLGSAFVEMWLTESGVTKKVVFSGDIGSRDQPIIRDPQPVTQADIVVMESTYGDRNHEASQHNVRDLATVIDKTLAKGGNVVFPTFAVGRTQELLYFIREMKEQGLVRSVRDFPVYLDSPLASRATKIYSGSLQGYLDDETLAVIKSGSKPLHFDGLRIVETAEESKSLNDDPIPKVIISSSGMCEAGRVRHHLKHNLWRRESAVVFTGFQARGTLGRILEDGHAQYVTLFGEEIAVKCGIYSFQSMSAHADRRDLLLWARAFSPTPETIFVVHGESEVCKTFTLSLIELGYRAKAPKYASIYDIMTGETVFEGRDPVPQSEHDGQRRDSPVYLRLLQAGTSLLEVITRNRGGANKDLAKFADQIDALAKKWDR